MLSKNKFDIVALTETWLSNTHQQNYVQLPDYTTFFKNRENRRGGGVGFFVRKGISAIERKDLGKLDESIEHLWIKVLGRNKNSPYLVAVFYQPTPTESDKQDWLEQFDTLLSTIYVKWSGIIIIAGDFNKTCLITPRLRVDIKISFILIRFISISQQLQENQKL